MDFIEFLRKCAEVGVEGIVVMPGRQKNITLLGCGCEVMEDYGGPDDFKKAYTKALDRFSRMQQVGQA